MGNFLDNVAARSLTLPPVVRPRPAAPLEPLAPVGGFGVAPAFETETSASTQPAPHVDEQSAAQTTNAGTFEMRPAHAPQVGEEARPQNRSEETTGPQKPAAC